MLILTSSGSARKAREVLTTELAPLIRVHEGSETIMAGQDPGSFIRILGDALDWLPLKVAAGIFLGQIGKNAADDIWKNKAAIAKALATAVALPFRKLVEAFRASKRAAVGPTSFSVGLKVPDGHSGVRVTLPVDSSEEVAVTLALFLHHAESIENEIKQRESQGVRVLPNVSLRFELDGSAYIVWYEPDSNRPVEVRIRLQIEEPKS